MKFVMILLCVSFICFSGCSKAKEKPAMPKSTGQSTISSAQSVTPAEMRVSSVNTISGKTASSTGSLVNLSNPKNTTTNRNIAGSKVDDTKVTTAEQDMDKLEGMSDSIQNKLKKQRLTNK